MTNNSNIWFVVLAVSTIFDLMFLSGSSSLIWRKSFQVVWFGENPQMIWFEAAQIIQIIDLIWTLIVWIIYNPAHQFCPFVTYVNLRARLPWPYVLGRHRGGGFRYNDGSHRNRSFSGFAFFNRGPLRRSPTHFNVLANTRNYRWSGLHRPLITQGDAPPELLPPVPPHNPTPGPRDVRHSHSNVTFTFSWM